MAPSGGGGSLCVGSISECVRHPHPSTKFQRTDPFLFPGYSEEEQKIRTFHIRIQRVDGPLTFS